MLYAPYRTQFRALMQEQEEGDEAFEQLMAVWDPEEVECKAIELGAWKRSRELTSPWDLLRGLLYRACFQCSYDQVASWATLKGLGCLSGEAWRKRFIRAAAWVEWLLLSLLSVHQRPGWLEPSAGRLLLVDATREATIGGTGDDVRVHWCYDLLAGQSAQLDVSDRHQAEKLSWVSLQAGDVVVTDAGYPVGSTVEAVHTQHAACITRATGNQLRVETEQGDRIDLKQRLCRHRYGSTQHLLGWVRCPSGERRQVRVVAFRLPKDLSQKAQQRKAQQLRAKRGRRFNRELVWWAGWVVLVTTLPVKQWPDEVIVRIYRARWQIELVFKRIKSGMQWHRVNQQEWERVKTEVHVKLIVWLLQEQQQQQVREQLRHLLHEPAVEDLAEVDEEPAGWVLSTWAITMQTLEWVAGVVRGSWSAARWQACQPFLLRYWRSRPRRKRPQQESSMRDWIPQWLNGSSTAEGVA